MKHSTHSAAPRMLYPLASSAELFQTASRSEGERDSSFDRGRHSRSVNLSSRVLPHGRDLLACWMCQLAINPRSTTNLRSTTRCDELMPDDVMQVVAACRLRRSHQEWRFWAMTVIVSSWAVAAVLFALWFGSQMYWLAEPHIGYRQMVLEVGVPRIQAWSEQPWQRRRTAPWNGIGSRRYRSPWGMH